MNHGIHRPTLQASAIICLLGGLLSCHGGGTSTPHPPAVPGFTLSATPSGIRIPAGGGTYVVVTLSRLNGFQDAVDLSLTDAPAGINAQGRIEKDAGTCTMPVSVAANVGALAFNQIQLKGTSGTVSQTTPFPIQVLAALPPTSFSPHQVLAGGATQIGSGTQNQAVVREGAQATSGTASGITHRSGFHPTGDPVR